MLWVHLCLSTIPNHLRVLELDTRRKYEYRKHRRSFRWKTLNKNPAYGRQRISQPMRIVGLIQFLRGCMIYLREEEKKTEKKRKKLGGWRVHASTRPRVHASTRPRDGSTRGRWTLCTRPPFLGLHACNKMDAWPMGGHDLLHTRACLIPRKKLHEKGTDSYIDR